MATTVWVCTNIGFIFEPIGTFISTLFTPVIISGFLYYLFRPLVNILMKVKINKFKVNRTLAVVIIFILLGTLVALGLIFLIPLLASQIGQLIAKTPTYLAKLQELFNQYYNQFSRYEWVKQLKFENYADKFGKTVEESLQGFMGNVTTSLGTVIGTITSITVTAITVPFMLFYMLKDGHRLIPNIKKILPARSADKTEVLLGKMGDTISKYIGGQAIECSFVATFTFLGYWAIGMPYAFLLGVLAGITNIIPYIGPYIGLLPALILALFVSPKMFFTVIVVCVIVQQVDGNLIYPNVIGKSLDIHPLTIIILLLVAGNIAGLTGMILGIPAYAVLKVMIKYFIDIYRLKNDSEHIEK
ncbi:hypothetical protein FC81_GL000037 [Liquorilactobacillus capillatus DSM 19910]|uniref:Permease n=1 Tax=Liquorilactobacillus capillatus DSM 19910 TaxID=1423731 RepID=A0A0R1M3H3_9LACO|nr:hypothetical protein FC81_GL000037 [Liquorilactobacillus capillatus DSM 19910]